jgi:hypothetical protein
MPIVKGGESGSPWLSEGRENAEEGCIGRGLQGSERSCYRHEG